jgi:predicted MFS family arabinose efflux permease
MKVRLFRKPLRRTAFRNLWFGLMVSRFGDQFTALALVWFILQITGSGAAVGLVILCFRLPPIISGALAGRLLDRYQPRRLIALDNVARALVIGSIPVLFWFGMLNMPLVYALALVAGALTPITEVGTRMLLPHLVADEELEGANALISLTWQVAFLLGPVVAGLAVAQLGGPWVLLIDAATFLLMGILLTSIPQVARQQSSGETDRSSRFGFGTLARIPAVRAVTALSLVFFFAYGPLETALPIYSLEVTRTGPTGYGLLWSAFGMGAMLGLLLLNRVASLARPGVVLAVIAVLWGLCLLPLTVFHSLSAAMLFLCLAGLAWSPYNVIETSMIQRAIPAHLRGRVFGARSTLLAAGSPLGAALGGVLLDRSTAVSVIGFSALACMIAGLCGLLSTTLRNVTRTRVAAAAAMTTPSDDELPAAQTETATD